jgi:hypothetical protein
VDIDAPICVSQDDIRERPADVDADPPGRRELGLCET